MLSPLPTIAGEAEDVLETCRCSPQTFAGEAEEVSAAEEGEEALILPAGRATYISFILLLLHGARHHERAETTETETANEAAEDHLHLARLHVRVGDPASRTKDPQGMPPL